MKKGTQEASVAFDELKGEVLAELEKANKHEKLQAELNVQKKRAEEAEKSASEAEKRVQEAEKGEKS